MGYGPNALRRWRTRDVIAAPTWLPMFAKYFLLTLFERPRRRPLRSPASHQRGACRPRLPFASQIYPFLDSLSPTLGE